MSDSDGFKRSLIVKHSVSIGRHRTSISMEKVFLDKLKAICRLQGKSMKKIIEEIDGKRDHENLSSAIRIFVLENRP